MIEGIPAQPEVLKWARVIIGKSIEEVARAIKRPASEVQAWESGRNSPTYSQLSNLAYNVYKRPLALFFFPAPPKEADSQQEFRSLPRQEIGKLSSDTRMLIRRARAYIISMEEIFDNKNPAPTQVWNHISLSLSQSVEQQANAIGRYVISPKRRYKAEEALKEWRLAIENAGIFVFRSPFVKDKDISGFCLFDERFPIIFLNSSNGKTRQIFTLLHELAHLLLRSNGIDRDCDERFCSGRNSAIEAFCDKIAAELLLPAESFDAEYKSLIQDKSVADSADDVCKGLAARFCASQESVFRRMLDRGFIKPDIYRAKLMEIRSRTIPASQGGGGSYYTNQKSYLSDAFVSGVFARYYNGRITKSEAAERLNIKPKNFDAFEGIILQGASV
jgi:Zn-dependent peptidase ImmA (M78 family)